VLSVVIVFPTKSFQHKQTPHRSKMNQEIVMENNNNGNNVNDNNNNNPTDNNIPITASSSCSTKKDLAVPAINLLDVVGVNSEDSQHAVCGHHINIGDKFVTKWEVGIAPKRWQLKGSVTGKEFEDMDLEEQVKVYKLSADGSPSCHVGYLARRVFKQQPAKSLDLTFLRAKEDLWLSLNAHECGCSNRMLGIVVCEVIRNNTN
jgi:hypothetical protein